MGRVNSHCKMNADTMNHLEPLVVGKSVDGYRDNPMIIIE